MWLAALVHVFTAMGIVCALFATRAVFAGAWEAVFAWLAVALVIDGLDGALARLARVDVRLPRFSGERLDLVIDYATYVFIPALALLQAGYLAGWFGLVLAAGILVSSLFHFADTGSKAEDYSFVGFPAIWNLVAFYIFAFSLSQVATALVVVGCIALTFVPWKWVHPMRTSALRPLTLVVFGMGSVAAIFALWAGFPAVGWVRVVLAAAALYGLVLTVCRGWAS